MFLSTRSGLSPDAKIVQYKYFESAIVKLQEIKTRSLTPVERKEVEYLRNNQLEVTVVDDQVTGSLSFYETALKSAKSLRHHLSILIPDSCYPKLILMSAFSQKPVII